MMQVEPRLNIDYPAEKMNHIEKTCAKKAIISKSFKKPLMPSGIIEKIREVLKKLIVLQLLAGFLAGPATRINLSSRNLAGNLAGSQRKSICCQLGFL